jgi:hemerythrin-like metal-binding protein
MFFWNKPKPESASPSVFLPWTSDLKIGIQQFDLEHKRMGSLINQLHTLMVIKRDRDKSIELTEVLLQATRAHFDNEEALLTKLGYTESEDHYREHSKLIDELKDLQRQFKAGTLSALAMPTFLKKWLLDHIQNVDRKYVTYLRAKGIP